VYILEAHRGQGLSKWLMETIHAHPELQGLRRWMLATRDAHGLYVQFGWKPLNNPDIVMEIYHPNIYNNPKV
jgi:GNAT superfamily N-acetyltransferase